MDRWMVQRMRIGVEQKWFQWALGGLVLHGVWKKDMLALDTRASSREKNGNEQAVDTELLWMWYYLCILFFGTLSILDNADFLQRPRRVCNALICNTPFLPNTQGIIRP